MTDQEEQPKEEQEQDEEEGYNRWAMPKFNKWWWVVVGALVCYAIAQIVRWVVT